MCVDFVFKCVCVGGLQSIKNKPQRNQNKKKTMNKSNKKPPNEPPMEKQEIKRIGITVEFVCCSSKH